MKKAVFIASLGLLLNACATQISMTPTPVPSFETAAEAIAAAEAATKEIGASGYAWRDTDKLIEAAKKAEAAKDAEKAMQLAIQALRQSKNAMLQYEQQKDAASRF